MKHNKRMFIPDLEDNAEEIRANNVKRELREVFVKYMKEHCDEKGNIKDNNLTKEQVKTIKELKDKIKNENLVCIETDKTGRFALDTKANYITKIKKHIQTDEVISRKKVTNLENKLNVHFEHAVRITRAGENVGQGKRIKEDLETKDNPIPVLYGTSKDHKPSINE